MLVQLCALTHEQFHAAAFRCCHLRLNTHGIHTLSCMVCDRTKADGYVASARWDRLAFAKDILGPSGCPVVGNGDVDSPHRYQDMLVQTGVDGVMIGRAAVSNPFIFYGIRYGLQTTIKHPCGTLHCSTLQKNATIPMTQKQNGRCVAINCHLFCRLTRHKVYIWRSNGRARMLSKSSYAKVF